MKLLFCLGSLDKGGTQRVVSNLSNYFVKDNSVCIITTKKSIPQYPLDSNVKIYNLDGEKRRNNLLRIFSLIKIVKQYNPDVILTFQPEPSFRVLLANIFLRRKIILSVRNDPNVEYSSSRRKLFMRCLYPKANLIILQTPDAKKYFERILDDDKMIVIPNPINDDFLNYNYSVISRDKVIVTVGRLEPQKNQKMLIESFQKVLSKFPEYKLFIYGEGKMRTELTYLIDELGLNNKVVLKGQVDNIKDEIKSACIFVLSSDYEGMPNALMEAMALGIPCISTDCPCGGPNFLIENETNGLLVPVGDGVALTNAICYLIEEPDKAKILGNNARKICEELNPRIINEKWKTNILKIMEGKGMR